MPLIPFRTEDASTVSGWATDPIEVAWWCGHPVAPVPAPVIAGWADRADVYAFGMRDGVPGGDPGGDPAGDRAGDGEGDAEGGSDGQLIAYGELWVNDDEAEAELARLIVAPTHRGRGVGRQLVTELTRLARAYQPEVFLRVHPNNAVAVRCYLGAGFTPVTAELQAGWNAHQPIPYIWLTHPTPRDG